jgi:hypothetical protein
VPELIAKLLLTYKEPSRDAPADQEPSMCSETISVADLADGIIVKPYMESLLNPIAIDEVKLLEYIPYARRRITEVLFPTSELIPAPDAGKPAYLSQLCCVMTVPSPWTEAEGWRRSPLAGTDHEDEALPDADVGPLELEEATMEDPSRLAIWIERSALADDSTGHSLVGMALRGRWGLFGIASGKEGDQWWAFRSKDCKLWPCNLVKLRADLRYPTGVVVCAVSTRYSVISSRVRPKQSK